MNYCFIIGKVVTNPDFKFIIKGKDVSVCIFNIELNNRSIIEVRGYNEIADYIYRHINLADIVAIEGKINESYMKAI